MFKFPEQHRVRTGNFVSYEGGDGIFIIPHYRITGYYFTVVASKGAGWYHVSVTVRPKKNGEPTRCPTWEEMCFIKDTFWDETDAVVQYHPPKSKYVNMHKYCLHLWQPIGRDIPVPDSILVGL